MKFKVGDRVYHIARLFPGVGTIEKIEKYGERIIFVRYKSTRSCYESYAENLMSASDPEDVMKDLIF